MSSGDIEGAIRSIVALAGGIGGLWFILRMAIRYQHDFTDQYAARVQRQDARIDALEAEITGLHNEIAACGQREARLRLALIQSGINITDRLDGFGEQLRQQGEDSTTNRLRNEAQDAAAADPSATADPGAADRAAAGSADTDHDHGLSS